MRAEERKKGDGGSGRKEGRRAEGGVAREEGEERKSTKGSRKEKRMGCKREMWMHWGAGEVTYTLLEGCAEERETARERSGEVDTKVKGLMTTPVLSRLIPVPEPYPVSTEEINQSIFWF